VWALDSSSDAIAYAIRRYSADNITFLVGTLPAAVSLVGKGYMDLIVSFEFIEHISPRLGKEFFQRCWDRLADGGKLIFSTPVRYRDDYPTVNPYHQNEMTVQELDQFLMSTPFRVEARCGQGLFFGLLQRGARLLHKDLMTKAACVQAPADHNLHGLRMKRREHSQIVDRSARLFRPLKFWDAQVRCFPSFLNFAQNKGSLLLGFFYVVVYVLAKE